MPGFDLKQVSRNDKGVLGAGIVALIFSFVSHYYGGSVNVGGFHYSAGVNAWHSYAFFGMLLILLDSNRSGIKPGTLQGRRRVPRSKTDSS